MANKWETLKHKGPVFPPLYEYQKYEIKVQGRPVVLSQEAEEMVYAWAQKHATDYVKDPVFRRNFWKCLRPLLSQELRKTSFPDDWDLRTIVRDIEYKKEVKKNRSKEVKKQEKLDREALKEEYGFAELDGKRLPLGNYMVEPPGLFMGRGKHPLRGSWKPRIYPEDVTINASEAPIAPEGHSWKEVVENKNKVELAGWNCKLTGKWKPILFNAASSIKQSADQKKFNRAIEVAQKLDYINSEIDNLLNSKLVETRKLATVAKLIAQLAIRVGDEKGEDEADTVGASSLRVEHVEIKEDQVVFDFLGKDSVRYYNTVKFSQDMIRNLNWLVKDKKPGDQIFSGVNSSDVNEFLGNIMEGLTAKQFRTAYGSRLLAEELAKEDVSELTLGQKLKYFTDANLAVAVKLNHQSAVSPAYKISLKNMKDKLSELKKELKEKKQEMKDELEKAKDSRDVRIITAKTRYKGDRRKDSIRRARETYERKVNTWNARINRLTERIENLKTKLEIKEKTKGIALGTSKTNYSDPRIAYSYCKKNNVDIKKIFTPTLQKKFEWADEVSSDFYTQYPHIQEG